MPTYKIKDPQTGRVLRVTGDSPPTEDEANELFATQRESREAEPMTDYTRQVIEAGKPKLSGGPLLGARALEFTQGGLLGWGDEAQGVIGGIDSVLRGKKSPTGETTFTGGYEAARDRARQALSRYEQERPLEALGVNAAGGLPLVGGAGASVARAAPLGARLKRAAATGAGIGAIAGAGSADGDLEDRAGGAAFGSLLGSTMGLAFPLVPAAVRGGKNLINRARLSPEEFAARYVSRAFEGDAINTADALASGKPLIDVGGSATTAAAEQGALSGKGRQIAEQHFNQAEKAREGTLLGAIKKTISDKPLYDKMDELASKRSTDATPLYQAAYTTPYRRTPKLTDLARRPAVGGAMRSAITRLKNDPDINPDEVEAALGPILGKDFENLSDAQITQRLTQAMGTRPLEFKVLDYIKRGLDHMVGDGGSNEVRRLRNAWREELKAINPKYQEALNSWAGPARILEALEEGRGFHKLDPEAIERLVANMGDSEREAFQVGVSRQLQDLASGAGGKQPGHKAALSLAEGIDKNGVMQRRLQAALGTAGAQPEKIITRSGWKPTGNGTYRNATKPGQVLNFDKTNGVWSLEQTSKTGKSSSLLSSGDDIHSLESILTGNAAKPASGPQSVDELIAISRGIADTAAKQAQIVKGSPTARRLAGAEEFDGLEATLAEGAQAARGGKWNLLGHVLNKGYTRAVEGLSDERRAAVSKLLFSKDPAERARGIEMIDRIRSGRSVTSPTYRPRIAPRSAGVTITSANTQGE